MATKMCDCNQGRLPCHMQCRDKPQATKFTQQEMRERSPSGIVHMDSIIGKNFTAWFLIKCGLVGIVAAYLFDWIVMSMSA